MTKDLHIRATQPAEAPAILAITRETGVFSAEEIDTLDELLRDYTGLGPEQSGYYFLSGVQGGQLVGYVCYGPRAFTQGTFDIFWLCSQPAAQGKGVGSALSRQAERDIAAMGGRLVIIETSTRPDYEPARRVYEKLRYRCEAVIKDFYHQGDGLVLYSKRVDRTDGD